MALLHRSYKLGYELYVVHVNYQKRDTAIRDERIVTDFCRRYRIPLEILRPNYQKEFGNFQAWARDVRYDFALKMADKYQIDKILVAHHLDDLVETYLIQKDRGATPENYGLAAKVAFKNCYLIRPCLKESKEDLLNYCIDNQVDYGIDESNLEDDYLRNRFRHQVVSGLSYSEKAQIYQDLEEINQKRRRVEARYYQLIQSKEIFNFKEILELDDPKLFLRLWIKKDLSDKYLNEILFQLKNAEKIKIDFSNKFLIKEYKQVYLLAKDYDYSYTIDSLKYFKTDFFEVKKDGNSFSYVSVDKSDFPLTIRNYQQGDKIEMRYGSKKLSRWFIDHKILTKNRLRWPVVVNSKNKIILVPEIGCDLRHFTNKESFFVVQYLINWN